MKLSKIFHSVILLSFVAAAHGKLFKKNRTKSSGQEVDRVGSFSGRTTVQVEGKGTVTMAEVQVGDKVLTTSSHLYHHHKEDDVYKYELVYAFAHHLPDKQTDFLKFHLQSTNYTRQVLEVSHKHLLYVSGRKHPVRAGSIKVGDALQGHNEVNNITKISSVSRRGIYAPLTEEGHFLAAGTKASCYVTLQSNSDWDVKFKGGVSTGLSQHSLLHVLLSPFRVYIMMGGSHPETEQDMPEFVQLGIDWFKVADNLPLLLQVPLLMVSLLVFGAFLAFEVVYRSPQVSLAILTISEFTFMTCQTILNISKETEAGDGMTFWNSLFGVMPFSYSMQFLNEAVDSVHPVFGST